MHACVSTVRLVTAAIVVAVSLNNVATAYAQTFKLAYYNIKSGFGQIGLPGSPVVFAETSNCTDMSQPLNAWGVGFVQTELTNSVAADPSVVALGLAEAWTCATPDAVQQVLGWTANTGERNGVAIVARYGFAGPAQWLQLDTSQAVNPGDTMWVVTAPVCLDAPCSRSFPMYATHWGGRGTTQAATYTLYEGEATETINFLEQAGDGVPRVLIGDLNVYEGASLVCGEGPLNAPVRSLRMAGYLDAWRSVYAAADGSTSTWNRSGCGIPAGNLFKRIDAAWSKFIAPLSIRRFGMVTPGTAAPSDHAGIIVEYPQPDSLIGTVAPTVSITSPAENAPVTGTITVSVNAWSKTGLSRVEFLVDGLTVGVDTSAPYAFAWDTRLVTNATHVLTAAATDVSGNRTVSMARTISVENPALPGDEIVMHGAEAQIVGSAWRLEPDATAASNYRLQSSDLGVTASLPSADPSSYVEFTFSANAGQPYRLWIRGKAASNAPENDSVFAQFDGSVTSSGVAAFRIGTNTAVLLNLEQCEGCGLSGWGWRDGGYPLDVIGPPIYFASTGMQHVRFQASEDGLGIDQVVLSAVTYRWASPGAAKDDATILPSTSIGPPPPNTAPTVAITSPANGATFRAPASIALAATASDSDGTVSRVEFYAGSTLIGTDTAAPYAVTWSNVNAGSYTLTARAIDNAGAVGVSAAVSITVSGSSDVFPSGWFQQDIGTVGLAGSASVANGTWTVSGSGADVWGTSDQFHFVYESLSGDGQIVARVATEQNVNDWTKAGVMMRETTAANARQGFMLVTPSGVKGLAFQRRVTTGGLSTDTSGGSGMPPAWVKLTRSGSTVTAYRSADGVTWTLVGSDTIAMASTVMVGLAVGSHDNTKLANATFDHVSVTAAPVPAPPPANVPPSVTLTTPKDGATFTAPASIALAATASDSDGTVSRVEFYAGSTLIGTDPTGPYAVTWNNVAAGSYSLTARATDNAGASATSAPVSITVSGASGLPAPWAQQDVGAVGVAGSATYRNGTWSVSGSGADVWGTSDQFHFVYESLSGNGEIVARVATEQNVNDWTKAGVMIRETTAATSEHAFMLVTPSGLKGLAFQRRVATGGTSASTWGGSGTPPGWVKLTRAGSTVTAYRSVDGVTWTLVGSDTIAMASTVMVGLAVGSHDNTKLATATFDHVIVKTP